MCSSRLRAGLSYRHSAGPGRASRWIAALGGVLGLASGIAALLFGGSAFGGYGVASACLVGVLVWVVINQIAARCPRSRVLRCKACGWRCEVASD